MNEVLLPPAPNWYQSSIFSCANDGTIAWVARNSIIISKQRDENKMREYSYIQNAHIERVNSIAFSPEYGKPDQNFLVSGGEESIIRVWNLDINDAVFSRSYPNNDQKIIGVDWSKSDSSLICSISTDGILLSWNLKLNYSQTIFLGKTTATCIACCPHKSNIVAVGSKFGLVYIVNLKGSGSILNKVRGNDTEIITLSWCPTAINIFDHLKNDPLFATGGRNKTISFFRVSDGRLQYELFLPNNPLDSEQHRTKLNQQTGNFTVVCWLEPKLLLSSSMYGELLAVDLSSMTNKPKWHLIHGGHIRGIFSINAAPKCYPNDEENWRTSSKHQVWTTAQDRKIIGCKIENGINQINYSILSQSGFIYCIEACPLATSLIAFGGGDAAIRLWDLSGSHENIINITCYWQKVKAKVNAIAWHPKKENILAFGTGEGRVGIFDTNSSGKLPILYRQHHTRTVYSLGWGPNPTDDTIFALYSCSNYELIYYESDKAKDRLKVIKKNCTEFAWNPNYTCMATGSEDGSITFVDKKLEPCGKPIFLLKKAIQRLAWHPDSTESDLNISSMKNYLAVAINDSAITIFDMTPMINQLTNKTSTVNNEESNKLNENDENIQYTIIGTLKGHKEPVVCLAWNPHITGQLVSGGYDHTAQVWRIDTMELIASFTGHHGTIYSCMWSPLNADYIITGSGDHTLRIWKISDQSVVIPDEVPKVNKSKNKNKKKKQTAKITHNLLENVKTEACDDSTVEPIVNGNKNITDVIKSGINGVKEELKENGVKEKKNKSKKVGFLPLYRKSMNDNKVFLNSCLKLARKVKGYDEETDSQNEDQIFSIFGNKSDVLTIMNNEQTAFTEQGYFTAATELSIWTNNFRQQLQDAAKERRLNEFMVSLAPMLSVKTWQEMCEAYANQLVIESNINKAVHYFLCIHKIYRAIEVLCDAKMFKEAYVLAKCKLDSQDIVIITVLENWAVYAVKTGNFEDATQCYILLDDFVKAAKNLAKRKDTFFLETAAELARIGNNLELNQSIADDAVVEALLINNPNRAEEIINKFPVIQYRLIHVEAFKAIIKIQTDEFSIDAWIKKILKYNLIASLTIRFNELKLDCSYAYNKLDAIHYPDLPENNAMFWLTISHQIALASASPTEEKKMHHIISTCGIISQYEMIHPVKSNELYSSYLIRLLAAIEPDIYFFVNPTKKNFDENLYKSFRSYFCFALLNLLVNKLTKEQNDDQDTDFVNEIVEIIKECLEDALDKETVKFWTASMKITKLENLIVGIDNDNVPKCTENKEEIENKTEKNDKIALFEQLEQIRMDKKKFIQERVIAPSPMLIYGKANELSNVLQDQNVKINFENLIAEIWRKIIS